MPALILYLLKVNVALVLFYLAYHFVLRRLTFYHLNRAFLIFGIAFSTLYPFIDLSELFSQHQELAAIQTYAVTIPAWSVMQTVPEQTPAFNYWQVPVFLFWIGTTIMIIRLLMQFISLYRIHTASKPAAYKSIGFRQFEHITQAFSFWQTIYLNPAQHKQEELESILRHEQIHVKGWHTLDVLLAELSTAFYWFNPGVWLMKKAVKENLEFIADQHVVNAGVDKKEYQYLLLKVIGTPEPRIANQFNFPSLKRRIAMMNKIPTKKAHQLKFLVLIPVAAGLLLSINGVAQTQNNGEPQDPTKKVVVTEVKVDKDNDFTEIAPNVFIKNNADLEYNRWIHPNTLIIKLKSGTEETYQLNDKKSLEEAKRKYGVWIATENKYKPTKPAITNSAELPVPPAPYNPDQDANTQKASEALQQSGPKSKLPADALYFINGVKATREAADKLDPKEINSINVYKGESAVETFGSQASKGVVSIITEKNKNSRQVQEFNKKLPAPPVPPAPGTPPPPAPSEPGTPPPPPAPAGEQLPPPPPPVKYDGPAIPKAGGPRLVENDDYVLYILWPEEITRKELEAAQQAFKKSGFDLRFDEKYADSKISGIKIELSSKKKSSQANAVYNTTSLQSLIEADNILLVQGNKKTGEVMIGATLAPRQKQHIRKTA